MVLAFGRAGRARAAELALDKRITDLESVENKLDASAKLCSMTAARAVVDAKNQIIGNVEAANRVIQNILDSDEIDDNDKDAAIQKVVDVDARRERRGRLHSWLADLR